MHFHSTNRDTQGTEREGHTRSLAPRGYLEIRQTESTPRWLHTLDTVGGLLGSGRRRPQGDSGHKVGGSAPGFAELRSAVSEVAASLQQFTRTSPSVDFSRAGVLLALRLRRSQGRLFIIIIDILLE
ncbi:Hypothetical predicted protein [Marmota monax]|uniref:Uncharacterized protein n=1 Tax=Marmota monax TaxID=9995 RepID=A0A5E4A3F9_MARMO|nr:hypothetical protein GHT09_008297 [Marmota monax]VTJ51614.1 Hypothetical predicted protein [Marmota monax]